MGNPIIPSYLTLRNLERSKSRSLTFWLVDLYGMIYYPFNLNVTKGSLVARGVFRCPSGLSCFHFMGSGFRDTDQFWKLPYLGMKLGKWPKCQKLHTLSFYPPVGSKSSLFLLYHGQQFLRHRPIFKIAIFRHETSPLVKVPEVAHIRSFYPQGVEIELIFAVRAAVSEIRANFQNCPTWAWNLG